jgi:acetyltransferase-like isoleucine patch superfamily enzyme
VNNYSAEEIKASILDQYIVDKLEWQPWTLSSSPLDLMKHQIYYDVLREYANAEIDQKAFISMNAKIFTDSLVLGPKSYISSNCLVRGHIKIGSNTSININCNLSGRIRIGDNTRIGSGTTIAGFNHKFKKKSSLIISQGLSVIGINIGGDCWIGSNSLILDGANIKHGCVIAAGAVVTKNDYPAYSIIAGNPAKVIGFRND